MFTLEQIRDAHSKVTSGADFPAYVQALQQLGITHYETIVRDGHTVYKGEEHQVASDPAYAPLELLVTKDATWFQERLKAHQEGMTDYMTFCQDAQIAGVEKWSVDLKAMTCTYYGVSGEVILVEPIPGV